MSVGVKEKVKKKQLIFLSLPENICEKHSKSAYNSWFCHQQLVVYCNNLRVQIVNELLHYQEIVGLCSSTQRILATTKDIQ